MKQINPKLAKALKIIKNKYVLVIAAFVVLMLFSKETNVFYYHHLYKQNQALQNRKEFYINEIKKDSINTAVIQKDIQQAEKYGREKYLMKRDNEDIFIIRHVEDTLIKNTIQ